MAIKALVYGWITYLVLSWLTSIGIFYSDIALNDEVHRWLPVIARAEDFFVAQGQMDFLKKAALIYEKDLMLLIFMLFFWALVCRFSLRLSFVGFLKVANYKKSYFGLVVLLMCIYGVVSSIVGPDLDQSVRSIFKNKLYSFNVVFGAFHYTLFFPTILPLVAVGVSGFLEPVKE